MSAGSSQSRIRILSTLIIDGRWYNPGEETIVWSDTARKLVGCGLAGIVETSHLESDKESPRRLASRASRKRRSR